MLDKIKQHLVDDWKQAYKFMSVWLAALLAVLDIAYDYIPQIQGYFPTHWAAYVGGAILLARIIRQSKAPK